MRERHVCVQSVRWGGSIVAELQLLISALPTRTGKATWGRAGIERVHASPVVDDCYRTCTRVFVRSGLERQSSGSCRLIHSPRRDVHLAERCRRFCGDEPAIGNQKIAKKNGKSRRSQVIKTEQGTPLRCRGSARRLDPGLSSVADGQPVKKKHASVASRRVSKCLTSISCEQGGEAAIERASTARVPSV